MRKRFKRKIFYKNKKGKIVVVEDVMFGGTKYELYDSEDNYIKDIYVPFRVADSL